MADLRFAADRLAVIATTDGLTGIANRRAFDDRLTEEWLRSIRAEATIALVMFDADFFKQFNDTYGHAEGDEVLRSVAACIVRNVERPGEFTEIKPRRA